MKTEVGISKKSSPNHPYEDRSRQLSETHPKVRASGRGPIFAVMDGVGAAPRAMQAAQLIADRLLDFYVREELPPTQKGLNDLLVSINHEVHAWGYIPGTDQPLGAAAATVAWFAPSRELLLVHAGDTLALRFDGDRISPLTREQGTGRTLTHYVGEGPAFDPARVRCALEEGETLCLVTDGVTKALAVHDIANVLREYPTPQRAAEELVLRAYNRGSRDDITALVVELEEW